MTLHEAEGKVYNTILMWYAAMVQREGRRHLLRVPAFWVPRSEFTVPYYFANIWSEAQQEQWLRQEATAPYIPGNVAETVAKALDLRLCDTRQKADRWAARVAPTSLQRGICRHCWEIAGENGRPKTLSGNNSHPIGYLTTSAQEWIEDKQPYILDQLRQRARRIGEDEARYNRYRG